MTVASAASFAEYAEELRPTIEVALTEYCRLGEGCPANLREAIQYALLTPGKRVRPMLALLAAQACGGETAAALSAACAVEMVHAYSLVHDDLPAMDDDDLRRGQPTCHKVYGEAIAILAGDALLAMAFEALANGVQPAATAAACCAVLATAAGPCQLVGGQADDIEGARAVATLEDLHSVHQRKTGAMIRASLKLGGMAVGANSAQLDPLDQYGQRLGLAFQITDDLLDARGSEAAVGKRVGKDAQRGKITFPGLLGLQQSESLVGELVEEACAALEPLGDRAMGLEALARYVQERNR